jgi:hypothetical protein
MSDVDMAERLRVFFASAPMVAHQVEVLEISHSAMTKTYRLWRETEPGTVTTENGEQAVEPWNFQLKRAGTDAHLDQVYEIPFDTTDTMDEFREQMARIPLNTTERVRIVIREYLSDDLTEMLSRAVLQVEEVSYKIGAAVIHAAQPRLNSLRTGENYTPREVPMLRNFL